MMMMLDDEAEEEDDDDRAEENANGENDDAEEERQIARPPSLLVPGGCCLPRCSIALDVILPVPIEGPPPFDDFRTRVKNFPQFASMRLLTTSMRFTREESDGLQMHGMNDALTDLDDAKVKEIMLHAPLDTRSMLSGRDAELGQHMRNIVVAGGGGIIIMHLSADERKRASLARLESFRKGLRLTLAIVRTRATGSDNYTNERVAALNDCFMSPAGRAVSKAACADTHREICSVYCAENEEEDDGNNDHAAAAATPSHHEENNNDAGCVQRRRHRATCLLRMGNCDDEAQRFFAKCISSCNVELNLKPDNLYLFLHLLLADMMLSLDYHRSTLEAAPNGIGATIIVCDGGGNYRCDVGLVLKKDYGTGADYVTNAYIKATEVPRYIKGCPFKCNYFEELKHATELSIVQTVCNSYIGTGDDVIVDKTITEAMKRTYATEFVANNSQASMNSLKALTWLVERNTTMSGDNGVYKTTSETDEKKGRHTFVYKPAISGLVLFCTNSVHPACFERLDTMSRVSRKVASSAHTITPADSKEEVRSSSSSMMCRIIIIIIIKRRR